MSTILPQRVREMAPSRRLVFFALDDAQSLTFSEVQERTALCTRSVTGSLTELREAGFVDRRKHPVDARGYLYETDVCAPNAQSPSEAPEAA